MWYTKGNSVLLLRQFHQSLTGIAVDWYYSLEDGSIKTWNEMEDTFRAKFTTVSDRISIANIADTQRKKNESMLDYITWWQNLIIKCETTLEQSQAVEILEGNIDN